MQVLDARPRLFPPHHDLIGSVVMGMLHAKGFLP